MADTSTVYASIGNSDDKLTQARWSSFHDRFTALVRTHALRIYGDWTSTGTSPWQNACIAFEIGHETTKRLQHDLAELAGEYGQDSIAWAEADTQFIGPTTAAPATSAPPSTLADDVLNWLRDQPDDGDHSIHPGPLTIEQDIHGNVRLVDVPDTFTIDIALLRHPGLQGVSFEDGTLTIDDDTDIGWTHYRTLYAYDHGFSVACRREA